MIYLLLFGLFISNSIHADDVIEVEDLSISYRKFLPKSYGPIIINQDFDLPSIKPLPPSSTHIEALLPQIQSISDINLNVKVNIFKYFYYRGNIDLYSFRLVWYESNDYTIPRLSSGIGIEYSFINIEYMKAFYPVENQYLNNFFPQQDSIMFRLIILGRKK